MPRLYSNIFGWLTGSVTLLLVMAALAMNPWEMGNARHSYVLVVPGPCSVHPGTGVYVAGLESGKVLEVAQDSDRRCRVLFGMEEALTTGDRIVVGRMDLVRGVVILVEPGQGSPIPSGSEVHGDVRTEAELARSLGHLEHTVVHLKTRWNQDLDRARESLTLLRTAASRLPVPEGSPARVMDRYRRLTDALKGVSLPDLSAYPNVASSPKTIRSLKNDLPTIPSWLPGDARAMLQRSMTLKQRFSLVQKRANPLKQKGICLFDASRHGAAMALAQDRRLFDDLKVMLFNIKNAPMHFMLKKGLPGRW